MKRVLMLGLCPLPTENETHTLGPGKRTWQFAQALLHDGHKICLLCSRHLAAYQSKELEPIVAEEHGNLVYYSLNQKIFEDVQWLQRLHDNFNPDCIIGATAYPSYIATYLKTTKPIWIDLFGHMMAEAQTKSYVFKDDYYISHMWRTEQRVLSRGDIFSVVSSPQEYATIGELGTQGRLNRATTGYNFLRIIPCAINDNLNMPNPNDEHVLRGKYVNADDFVVLWSGGYNTWTDVQTLFIALESAFEKNPRLKFVSTGGQIHSHDELTYKHFQDMILNSKYKDRFILKGWVPFNEVPKYWQEADIGINLDIFSYEAILGSRNRILDWMQSGLPILTTELCELSYIIKKRKLGFTFCPENPELLTNLLLSLSSKPDVLKTTAHNAKEFVFEEYTILNTTRPLRDWVNAPQSAPDINQNISINTDEQTQPLSVLKHYWASVRNQIKWNGITGTIRWMTSRYWSSLRKKNQRKP